VNAENVIFVLFLVLEELNRTGVFRKASYKGRYNFTINEDLMSRFRSFCKKNNVNMSGVIENLIKEFLKSKK